MLEWLNSAVGLLTLIGGFLLFCITTVAGGAWWASAVYFQLQSLAVDVHRAMDVLEGHSTKLVDHEARISALESKTGGSP